MVRRSGGRARSGRWEEAVAGRLCSPGEHLPPDNQELGGAVPGSAATRSPRGCQGLPLHGVLPLMAVIGPKTRAALRKLEGCPEVEEVRLFHDRVRTTFTGGLTETWDLDGSRPSCWRLPRSGWWRREPVRATEHELLRVFDADYDPHADTEFYYSASDLEKCGFLDRRVFVNRLARELASEGWHRPSTPFSALADDLERVRSAARRHALSTGFIRGQPGRTPRGVPAGLLLCNELIDWGHLEAPGRPTLATGWSDPLRLRNAIDALLAGGRPVTRPGIIHRMTCGQARGHPVKCAPRSEPISLWVSILRDVLGVSRHPVVMDTTPGCGARAIATAALDGAYIHPASCTLSSRGPAWVGGTWPALLPDDGWVCADVAMVDATDCDSLRTTVEDVGPRAASVVAIMSASNRACVMSLGLNLNVIRVRPRPFHTREEIMVIWRQ